MKQFLLLITLMTLASPIYMNGATVEHFDSVKSVSVDIDDEIILLTNPVKDGLLKLKVNKTIAQNVSVTIINSLGEQVFKAKSSTNKQVINFDISNLAAGIYFLRIQSDAHSTVKKLIIQ